MSSLEHEQEIQDLRRRVDEAEETLRAIRSGEVDALVVAGVEGERVFTLQGADHPYRNLIESMAQGAATLSVDGTVLYCNRSFANMLGRQHEKVIGLTVDRFLIPAQRAAFAALVRRGAQEPVHGEFQFQSAKRASVPVYVALNRLPNGDTVTLCMVATDLTEQKEHKNLQELDRRKDEFVAMLAHELRNPLAPMRNAVGLLQRVACDDDKLTYATDIIDRQVLHLARLVDDLLDLSRFAQGKFALETAPTDLGTVVSRAVEASRPIIESRKHRLSVTMSPGPVCVDGDCVRLAQVISNLLTNAAKYTEEGGHVSLIAGLENGDAVIRVRDDGIGISQELLPRIFDLFIQGDRSLARSEGGLGIGLTLVRRLVELHGGTVHAFSDGIGKGSEFVVRLPARLVEEQAAVLPKGRDVAGRNVAGRSILVAEDNEDAARSLTLLLELMGHRVWAVHSGTEALEAAAANRPDVALLDIGLPGINGYEVAERLREQPEHDAMVLIAMTGYAQKEDRLRSERAGFDHHLVKPVDVGVLERLLNSLQASPGAVADVRAV